MDFSKADANMHRQYFWTMLLKRKNVSVLNCDSGGCCIRAIGLTYSGRTRQHSADSKRKKASPYLLWFRNYKQVYNIKYMQYDPRCTNFWSIFTAMFLKLPCGLVTLKLRAHFKALTELFHSITFGSRDICHIVVLYWLLLSKEIFGTFT